MIEAAAVEHMWAGRMRKVGRIHFVGIGGAGMAGIAEVLLNLGYRVSGSDLTESAATRQLAGLGADIQFGHSAEVVAGADVVVRSTAVRLDNPEIVAAIEQRIPVIRRAEMLAELMRFRFGIAIAGTHGKTTTTSLVAAVLAAGQLDPTYVVGGQVKSGGSNARLGAGPYLVAEADESDASFLHLTPMITVVTNIDADHMETYGGDFSRLTDSFLEFLHFLPFYGLAVLCADDENLRELMPRIGRPALTYGFAEDADVRGTGLVSDGRGVRFNVCFADGKELPLRLNLPGRHNVQNALAAVAIGRELGVADAAIAEALAEFEGIGRRFEYLGGLKLPDGGLVDMVDDYGHHPRELSCALEAVRDTWPQRRLVVVFQPHRFSRTRDLFEDFVEVLSTADRLILTEVYPAGEAPIANADGRALSRAVRGRGKLDPVFVAEIQDARAVLADLLEDGDVLLTLGAGNIGQLAQRLIASGLEDVT